MLTQIAGAMSSKTTINAASTKSVVVIVGGGFGGLKLAESLDKQLFEVILIDKNNYHQFQPLFYQVATAGLEPSAISFPFRKIFHHKPIQFIMTEMTHLDPIQKIVFTSSGAIQFDFLVLATGTDNFYFGNESLASLTYGMKSTAEALALRNVLFTNLEMASQLPQGSEREAYLNVTIVGGGPTGIEIAGAIVELKNYILPKDYPQIDFSSMKITLIESSPTLLGSMGAKSGETCAQYLQSMGVHLILGDRLIQYDGTTVILKTNPSFQSKCLIWAAGVRPKKIIGLPDSSWQGQDRLLVNAFNQLIEYPSIFAIGDLACMPTTDNPNGHIQVAPVAIQQAKQLAANLVCLQTGNALIPFIYKHPGSMATVGRNKAVALFPNQLFIKGFLAWAIWLFVHLMSIVGVKNKFFIFLNWAWSYITFDQPLRLIIRPKKTKDL